MTVTYTGDVGNASIRTFCRLLARWKGSIWKAVYVELLAWIVAYAVLAVIYNLALSDEHRKIFENVCVFFAKYADFIPLTFILGFFVTVVVNRWLSMFDNLGWIDHIAMYAAHHIHGEDDLARLFRRSVVRHLLFYQVLCYRDISVCIRQRFPTLESCIDAGYLTEDELKAFDRMNCRFPQHWTPINWVMATLRRAAQEGRIRSDKEIEDLQRRVMDFRDNLGRLLAYDWVPIPLLYSQVVSISVRLYFVMALLGRQNLEHSPDPSYLPPINLYVPIVSIMQFAFYVGWLKVAEALLNPFGDDDDDFEINWLLDRNLEVGLTILDERGAMPLVKDRFWSSDVVFPVYSEATVNRVNNPMIGSAVGSSKFDLEEEEPVMIPRVVNDEEEYMRSRTGSLFGSHLKRRVSRMGHGAYALERGDHEQGSVAASPMPRKSSAAMHGRRFSSITAPSRPDSPTSIFTPFQHSDSIIESAERYDNGGFDKSSDFGKSQSKLNIVMEEEEPRHGSENISSPEDDSLSSDNSKLAKLFEKSKSDERMSDSDDEEDSTEKRMKKLDASK